MQHVSGKGLGKLKHKNYMLWEYDSIKELADHAKVTSDGNRHTSDRPANGEYQITSNFDEAHHYAIDGWHSIRDRVEGHLAPLREKLGEVLEVVRENMYDFTGSEPDMDRYIDGEVECMVDHIYQELPSSGKVFTMVIDSTLAWYNDAQKVVKRGAVLCALIEAFDMLGFQLEIWGEWTFRSYSEEGFASILTRFNNAGEPLDIDSLMFAVGSPDWFRRVGFALGEGNAELHKFGFCKGGYYGLHGNGSHMAERVGASCVLQIDGDAMLHNPVQWIMDQLAEQGVVTDG